MLSINKFRLSSFPTVQRSEFTHFVATRATTTTAQLIHCCNQWSRLRSISPGLCPHAGMQSSNNMLLDCLHAESMTKDIEVVYGKL